jgi:hypothetical protein
VPRIWALDGPWFGAFQSCSNGVYCVNKGAKTATITQNRTITSPTVAILDANRMESPAHMRLKTPTFLSTFMGAVGCSAVAMISPLSYIGYLLFVNCY